MAGHYPLKKEEEVKLFGVVDKLKNKIISIAKHPSQKDFSEFFVSLGIEEFKVMKLSKDYVENPETELAVKFGKVHVESITDQHESLTRFIDVEVHFTIKNKEIKDIFWVA
jgi:hypothetical protein